MSQFMHDEGYRSLWVKSKEFSLDAEQSVQPEDLNLFVVATPNEMKHNGVVMVGGSGSSGNTSC